MIKRLTSLAALLTLGGALPGAGCGSPPSVIGSWSSLTALSPSIAAQWSLQFTADDKFLLSFVTTNKATAGSGAGCVNTVQAAGTYSVLEPNLTVRAQNGTSVYEKCLSSAQNNPVMSLSPAMVAMLSPDFTGPFTVTELALMLNPPASGIGPGILARD